MITIIKIDKGLENVGKIGFGLIGFLVVFGGIFGLGWLAGGSAGTGMESTKQEQRIVLVDECLQTDDADEMRSCVQDAMTKEVLAQ